jgi:hypothetical protein
VTLKTKDAETAASAVRPARSAAEQKMRSTREQQERKRLSHASQFSKRGGSHRMSPKTISLFAVLMLLTACSPRDFLTRRLATDLISTSTEFRTSQSFVLQTGIISNQNYTAPEYLILQHHGWISANSTPCPAGMAPPPCWDVLMTPSGVDTIRTAVPANEATKPAITLPAARRVLVTVTGITKQGSTADVEFIWKWDPLNEIGAALYSGDLHYKSVVGFRQYDDGWRIIDGVPRSGQSISDALKNAEPAP